MFRVLLVQMPFADINRPSIGISLLKAGLARVGIACDIAYLNLDFARHIGVENYGHIDRFNGAPQLGEWLFAEALCGPGLPDVATYYNEVLRPAMAEPFGRSAAFMADQTEDLEMVAGLTRLRRQAADFLDECLNAFDWGRYDIVGFTSTFQQNTPSLSLARLVKSRHPGVLTALGGANCEGKMGVAMHRLFPFIDIVCSGEGDKSFVTFAASLAAGEVPPTINGIIRRVDGETLVPPALANPVQDMDWLPVPDYRDFFDTRLKLAGAADDLTVPIESSRGCWWGETAHCTFCGLNGGTMAFRTKSADRFLGELTDLVGHYGIRNFASVDNIIDMRYFQSVLPRLAKSDLGVTLFYETKANLNRSHVRLLRQSGVTQIQPGIESLSTATLNLMRKGVHAYQNIRLLRLCAEYLVHPSWNILGGFPGEDPDEYRRQADLTELIVHLTPPIYVGCVRLDRFSPLFEHATEMGVGSVRPMAAYRYIYPFAQNELTNLVYFFDFDYRDGEMPEIYLSDLRDAVGRWKALNAHDALVYLDDGKKIIIADRRPVSVEKRIVLAGLDREVYHLCEDGASLAAIARSLTAAGRAASEASLHRIVEKLVGLRIVIYLDDRYLALAVDGSPRIEMLADCLAAGNEPPADVAKSVRKLFDELPDVFGRRLIHHLERNASKEPVHA